MDINAWARRWNVPPEAVTDLLRDMGLEAPPPPPDIVPKNASEAWVQSAVRLRAPKVGMYLWRNNVGVLPNEVGSPVRFGLANDSSKLNKRMKSHDLIGWRSVIITLDMVGRRFAQFVSRECKEPGWTFKGTERENAQLVWGNLVLASGGDASFIANPEELR